MGSCVDNSRILNVLTEVVLEGGLGDDIDELPAVGIAPEWMAEKALAIGAYFAASGAHVIWREQPGRGFQRGARLMTEGWKRWSYTSSSRSGTPCTRPPELIDAKRAALKLPAYDPSQYGDSGDSLFFAEIKKYLADKAAEAERGVETVGSPVYPLADGHSHDHGDGHAHTHSHDEGEA
jgi:carbon-monoxide dehydrogenase catalytic subunit